MRSILSKVLSILLGGFSRNVSKVGCLIGSSLPKGRKKRISAHLILEGLEDRCLLAGVSWQPIGPAPQLSAISLNNQYASGRVSALAVVTDAGHQALLDGSAGGGLWESSDLTQQNLT